MSNRAWETAERVEGLLQTFGLYLLWAAVMVVLCLVAARLW